MKIWIAQINTKLWDIQFNESKIIDTISTLGNQIDLIVFPEMTITGYPLNDLLDDVDLVKTQKQSIYRIQETIKTLFPNLKVVVWFIDYNEQESLPSGMMKKFNAAAVIGSDIQIYHKHLLPNYDVFFEQRYFAPGTEWLIFDVNGTRCGVTICEDIWDDDYAVKPINHYKDQNIDLVINISSSPFTNHKLTKRLSLLKRHNKDIKSAFLYVNQVGGQDELVFDGWSMCMNKQGELIYFGKSFEEEITIIDLDGSQQDVKNTVADRDAQTNEQYLQAIQLGTFDYLRKTGIKDVVIGVSGWVDSALNLYILSQIIAPEHIHAIYMPSRHNADESFQLADQLCKNVGVELNVWPIQDLVAGFQIFGKTYLGKEPTGVTYENIQARLRGMILMNIANDVGGMVINNTNKTELDLGYGTLYGDLIGGLGLIGDLNKREVYALSDYCNQRAWYDVIPSRIITRKASAELADNQVDPFDYDRVSDAVEELGFGASIDLIAQKYNLPKEEVQWYKRRINRNEFKKQTAPLVIKLKHRSIGVGRLIPIVQW